MRFLGKKKDAVHDDAVIVKASRNDVKAKENRKTTKESRDTRKESRRGRSSSRDVLPTDLPKSKHDKANTKLKKHKSSKASDRTSKGSRSHSKSSHRSRKSSCSRSKSLSRSHSHSNKHKSKSHQSKSSKDSRYEIRDKAESNKKQKKGGDRKTKQKVIDHVPTAMDFTSFDSVDDLMDERSRYSRYSVDPVEDRAKSLFSDDDQDEDDFEPDDESVMEDRYSQTPRADIENIWSDSTQGGAQWRGSVDDETRDPPIPSPATTIEPVSMVMMIDDEIECDPTYESPRSNRSARSPDHKNKYDLTKKMQERTVKRGKKSDATKNATIPDRQEVDSEKEMTPPTSPAFLLDNDDGTDVSSLADSLLIPPTTKLKSRRASSKQQATTATTDKKSKLSRLTKLITPRSTKIATGTPMSGKTASSSATSLFRVFQVGKRFGRQVSKNGVDVGTSPSIAARGVDVGTSPLFKTNAVLPRPSEETATKMEPIEEDSPEIQEADSSSIATNERRRSPRRAIKVDIHDSSNEDIELQMSLISPSELDKKNGSSPSGNNDWSVPDETVADINSPKSTDEEIPKVKPREMLSKRSFDGLPPANSKSLSNKKSDGSVKMAASVTAKSSKKSDGSFKIIGSKSTSSNKSNGSSKRVAFDDKGPNQRSRSNSVDPSISSKNNGKVEHKDDDDSSLLGRAARRLLPLSMRGGSRAPSKASQQSAPSSGTIKEMTRKRGESSASSAKSSGTSRKKTSTRDPPSGPDAIEQRRSYASNAPTLSTKKSTVSKDGSSLGNASTRSVKRSGSTKTKMKKSGSSSKRDAVEQERSYASFSPKLSKKKWTSIGQSDSNLDDAAAMYSRSLVSAATESGDFVKPSSSFGKIFRLSSKGSQAKKQAKGDDASKNKKQLLETGPTPMELDEYSIGHNEPLTLREEPALVQCLRFYSCGAAAQATEVILTALDCSSKPNKHLTADDYDLEDAILMNRINYGHPTTHDLVLAVDNLPVQSSAKANVRVKEELPEAPELYLSHTPRSVVREVTNFRLRLDDDTEEYSRLSATARRTRSKTNKRGDLSITSISVPLGASTSNDDDSAYASSVYTDSTSGLESRITILRKKRGIVKSIKNMLARNRHYEI